MSVLVIYGTIEGQTGKIARFVEAQLKEAGHEAKVLDAGETADVSFDGIDKVILAAPVHERRHPPRFEALLVANKEALAKRPTLMMSVSLKAAFEGGKKEAADYLSEMEMRTGMIPDQELLVAGAVRAGAYGYFETEVLRHVVLDGQDFGPDDGPREFTDWDALAEAIAGFVEDRAGAISH